MVVTDRTEEFSRASEVFAQHGSASSTLKPQRRPVSESSRGANELLAGVETTERMLAQLSKLVSRKGFVNDPTQEINEVTDMLKKDMATLSRQVDMLLQRQAAAGAASKQCREHFTVIADAIKARLSKQAKSFQDALEVRTKVLKEQSERRSRFSHGGRSPMVQFNSPLFMGPQGTPPSASPPSSAVPSPSPSPSPTPPQPQFRAPSPSISRPDTVGMSPSPGGFMPSRDAAGQMATSEGLRRRANPYQALPRPGMIGQQQLYSSSQSARSRLEEAQQVETTIVELSGMFSKMATMVAQQGEIVQRIDEDMDVAKANIDEGQNELLKLYKTVSGNRSLIIKIFLLLIAFITLFVIIF